jgi:peptide-methionine (S)-S-oxide reductase
MTKTQLPTKDQALKGRDTPMRLTHPHALTGQPIGAPRPAGASQILFGMGCFWGAERKFWPLLANGLYSSAVGYSGGLTPNPTYEEVCSGQTGHNEVVKLIYDPVRLPLETLLKLFWESHNPTQFMRQGNDVGTQYRSGIYTYDDAQFALAPKSLASYQTSLLQLGLGQIQTELLKAGTFYYAEDYHQQYLHKNPRGYCGLGGTGAPYCAL